MEIKNYEVMINEENSTCGFIVDIDQYDINFLREKELIYEVDKDNMSIDIYSQNNLLISFVNIDNELMYYAFKSMEIPIIFGRLIPEAHFVHIMTAKLK